jgi:uncharacterized protein (DUF362 family)
MRSKVAIIKVRPKADEAELLAALEEAVYLLGGIEPILPPNEQILVKPNYGSGSRRNSVNARVTSSVLAFFSKNRYKVQIGEDPGCFIVTRQAYENWQNRVLYRYGIQDICEREGAEWVDFRYGPHCTVRVPEPLFFDELVISEYARKAGAIVSLAKLKVVNICSVSLSMKNMKGVMPSSMKRRFHCEELNQGIVDLCQVVKPKLAVIDGTYAMDQVAMKEKPVGLLLVSPDCVAVDAVGASILGFDPAGIEHLALAEKVGLGVAELSHIEVVGEALPPLIGKYTFSAPANPFQLAKESDGGIEIIQGQPCSTCLNELGSELLAFKGKLHRLRNVKILVGPSAQVPEGHHTVIFYGNCLKKYRDEINFVHGCPPGMEFLGVGSIHRILKDMLIEER